jgi:predicted RNA-binding protein YlqC (UPF0109 family)
MKWQEVEVNCLVRNFINCTLHKISLEVQVQEDEMGTICSTYGENRKADRIVVGTQKERDN